MLKTILITPFRWTGNLMIILGMLLLLALMGIGSLFFGDFLHRDDPADSYDRSLRF